MPVTDQSLGRVHGIVDEIPRKAPAVARLLTACTDELAAAGKLTPEARAIRDKVLRHVYTVGPGAPKEANASTLEMARDGLRELGQTVLDSGVPQALLTFAVTYKLIDGVLKAGDEAKQEFGIY